jgi:antitoxin component HigA of HigAB toxin-antitoxin module
LTRAAGVPYRRVYQKTFPHAADIMKSAMEEKGVAAAALSEETGVDEEIIVTLLERRKVMSSTLSRTLGPALGLGKDRLYKAHTAWIESGCQ